MQTTRTELYERVCTSPLSKIAPQFGISGAALAAICKQHQIPYPGSGHWTRKSLGLHTELPPLPDGDDQTIVITPPNPRTPTAKPVSKRVRRKAKDTTKPDRAARHPLLIGVEASFRKSRDIDEDEFLRPYKRLLPDVVASESALDRALNIANEIYTALDRQGYRVLMAPAQEKMRRIQASEQEMTHRDRRYGRYYTGSIWGPDRPTITYIGSVPVGLALTEMTERAVMRYINGTYYREDSRAVRSAKQWQLANTWTTDRDLPCGRFRLTAYSPLADVDWTMNWQESDQNAMSAMIPQIVKNLEGSQREIRALMTAAEEAAVQRQKEWEEQWERYRRNEDARLIAKALADSQQQFAEILAKWGRAMTVERFFAEAEVRLEGVADERHSYLLERLVLARSMVGTTDPLDFLNEWLSPDERYKTKYD